MIKTSFIVECSLLNNLIEDIGVRSGFSFGYE